MLPIICARGQKGRTENKKGEKGENGKGILKRWATLLWREYILLNLFKILNRTMISNPDDSKEPTPTYDYSASTPIGINCIRPFIQQAARSAQNSSLSSSSYPSAFFLISLSSALLSVLSIPFNCARSKQVAYELPQFEFTRTTTDLVEKL